MKRPLWNPSYPQTGVDDERLADGYASEREAMVARTIVSRGVKDVRVLAAMCRVPRHEFVPIELRESAYADRPLPIGLDQTISQPYIVAFMTEALRLPVGAHVLEVGTGSGYQAAVLAKVAARVFSVEIVPELAARAAVLLARLGYGNIEMAERDGSDGWPEHAPYDGILVVAAADEVPAPLVEQLKPGARLILPLRAGEGQQLVVVTRVGAGFREEAVLSVAFVPMTGRVQRAGHAS